MPLILWKSLAIRALGASRRNIYLEDGVTRQSLKMVFVYRFKHVLN